MSLRVQKLASRFVVARAARVDWSPALTVHSASTLRENLGVLDNALNKLKGVAASVPAEIPTVDWDSYLAKGVAPEEIAAIRATFESKSYPEPTEQASVKAVEAFGAEYVGRLEPNTEKAADLLNDLTALKKKMEEDFVTMKDWEAEDWARRFPGLVDKIRANHLVGDITNDEGETQYLNLDLKQLAADVREGKNIQVDMPAEIEEYYFGGISQGNDFPTTDPELVSQLVAPQEGNDSPAERANKTYNKSFGDLWQKVLPAL